MAALDFLDDALAELERGDLLRVTRSRDELDTRSVLLCTNDYLGLAHRTAVAAAPAGSPAESPAGGAGASALVYGYRHEHAAAEEALRAFTDAQACLLFTSGYAANVGLLAALAGRGDLIVSDALNHASIIDGCRLSGARVEVTPHLDLGALERALKAPARRRFVVTESYFSMDADGPDLRALRALCDRAGAALLVDEAHALGVLGPSGRGRVAEAGVPVDALVGTLGKAFGLAGAFVAGSHRLRAWLWNRARSHVFSTAMPPLLAAAVPARVEAVARADDLRRHLASLAELMRGVLADELGERPSGSGPIVPVLVGEPSAALAASRALLAQGWVVQAIRPPTVPIGTSRLRVTLHANLDAMVVTRAATAIARAVRTARASS